jgi:hypothetical protein
MNPSAAIRFSSASTRSCGISEEPPRCDLGQLVAVGLRDVEDVDDPEAGQYLDPLGLV